MRSISDDWIHLGDKYYRKINLYEMPWGENFSLSQFPLSVSPFTGCIALIITAQSTKPIIQLYEASGKLLFKQIVISLYLIMDFLKWKDAQIVKCGWSVQEELILVNVNGQVSILNLRGEITIKFGMGAEASERGIISANIFHNENRTGIAVMTNGFHIYLTTCLDEPKIRLLSEISDLNRIPDSWSIIPSFSKEDLIPRALVSFKMHLIVSSVGVCQLVQLPEKCQNSRAILFELSPDQTQVAIYFDSGCLWITDLNLEKPGKALINMVEKTPAILDDNFVPYTVQSLKWISLSALVLHWANVIALVSKKGDIHELFYSMDVFLEQEVDGVRILTSTSNELLQRVPKDLDNIGKIGPPSEAKLLHLMSENFDQKDGRANGYLDRIKTAARLLSAIDDCLNAASQSVIIDQETTTSLLKAAKLGICFLSIMKATGQQGPGPSVKQLNINQATHKLTYFCHILRFLSSLAVPWIGLKLTWRQFQSLGPTALLDRLLARLCYPMCLNFVKICSDMNRLEALMCPETNNTILALPIKNGLNMILTHWASIALNPHLSESELIGRINLILTVVEMLFLDPCSSVGDKLSVPTPCPTPDKNLLSGIEGLSFATIALNLIKVDKKEIAKHFLTFETNVSKVVPVLLKIQQESQALARSVDSGDPELIALVINKLKDEPKLPPAKLMSVLRNHPTALAIYLETCAASDPTFFESMHQNDSFESLIQHQVTNQPLQTKLMIKNAFKDNGKIQALIKMQEYYSLSKNDFMTHECKHQIWLLKFQKDLESKHIVAPTYAFTSDLVPDLDKKPFNETSEVSSSIERAKILPRMIASSSLDWVDQPAQDTILRLMVIKFDRQVEQLHKEHRVPDRHIRALRYIALGLQYQRLDESKTQSAEIWNEVDKALKARKPEYGLDILINVLRDIGRSDKAEKLIEKMPEEKRVRLLVLIGRYDLATELANKLKSPMDKIYIQENLPRPLKSPE